MVAKALLQCTFALTPSASNDPLADKKDSHRIVFIGDQAAV
jgi:hypothetical protein